MGNADSNLCLVHFSTEFHNSARGLVYVILDQRWFMIRVGQLLNFSRLLKYSITRDKFIYKKYLKGVTVKFAQQYTFGKIAIQKNSNRQIKRLYNLLQAPQKRLLATSFFDLEFCNLILYLCHLENLRIETGGGHHQKYLSNLLLVQWAPKVYTFLT